MPLSTTLIRLTPPTLPSGYCPESYQALANYIIGNAQATFQSDIGNTFFNYGSSTPSTDNQFYPWLDSDGFWWNYNGGYWNRKHPEAAGGLARRIYVGTVAQLKTYDGGSDTTVTDYTGPMWEVDTAFEAKFPVGVGTFDNAGTVSVLGTTTSSAVSGEDEHTLTADEIPAHTHNVGRDEADSTSGGDMHMVALDDGSGSIEVSSSVGGDQPHNNLPPFIGVYIIKRTARVYYTK